MRTVMKSGKRRIQNSALRRHHIFFTFNHKKSRRMRLEQKPPVPVLTVFVINKIVLMSRIVMNIYNIYHIPNTAIHFQNTYTLE